MIKLVGYETKTGVYTAENGTAYPYNNRVLHYTEDSSDATAGVLTGTVKVKMKDLASSFGVKAADDAVDSVLSRGIGKEIHLLGGMRYGKYVMTGISIVF